MPDDRQHPGWLIRLLARSVRATRFIDRAYHAFSRRRSHLVVRLADDRFVDAYNDAAYSADAVYLAGEEAFRKDLFDWERRVFPAWLPAPPARVLIGGAGGGREAFALARLGYRVVSFDPAGRLVRSMLSHNRDRLEIEGLVGSYDELPSLRDVDGNTVDLSSRPPFAAALLGWGSLSHVRTPARRARAVAAMANLTEGPLLLSYLPRPNQAPGGSPGRELFSVGIGWYQELSADDIHALATAAGLSVTMLDHQSNWPHAVLQRV